MPWTKISDNMRSFERNSTILSILHAQEHASIEAMASACGTSVQTIRRDLRDLEKAGHVVRFHGGATLPGGAKLLNYDAGRHLEEKQIAAELAADMVPNDASVFIAGGSTLALVARHLRRREGLTIITNNISAAAVLFDRDGMELHLVGGLARTTSGSITGEQAVEFIERFKVDIAFIGTSGIDADGTLLEYDQSIVSTTAAMIARCRRRVLVADSSKFDGGGIARGIHIREFDEFVTDRAPPSAAARIFEEGDVRVYFPGSMRT